MTSILPLLEQTHFAAAAVRRLNDASKQALLLHLADLIVAQQAAVLQANQIDLDRMDDADPKKDRLLLNPARLEAIAASIRDVAALPCPAGQVLSERTLPNGILLRKIAVPLGVVGIIYESRPNVTLDVSALCLRSGNAVALRGSSDAWHSNQALVQLIRQALTAFDVPEAAVTRAGAGTAHRHAVCGYDYPARFGIADPVCTATFAGAHY